MKKAACSHKLDNGQLCGRVRSHQTHPAKKQLFRTVLGKDAEGKDIIEERVQIVSPSVVVTDLCKQHAGPTKTHPKKDRVGPRHKRRKSMNREVTKKRDRKEK